MAQKLVIEKQGSWKSNSSTQNNAIVLNIEQYSSEIIKGKYLCVGIRECIMMSLKKMTKKTRNTKCDN